MAGPVRILFLEDEFLRGRDVGANVERKGKEKKAGDKKEKKRDANLEIFFFVLDDRFLLHLPVKYI